MSKALYIGLDIGGSKIMAAAADEAGAVLRRRKAPTPEKLSEGLELLAILVSELAAGAEIAAIGCAIGGPISHQSKTVSPLHQSQWRNVPLQSILAERFSCPVRIDIDTNVALLGEVAAAGLWKKQVVYVTISTGLGGSLWSNGQLFRGAGGVHPELGHQAISFRCSYPERVSCECGAPDCLEGLISGNAIRRIYQKPAEALDPGEWREVGDNLGQGLRNIAALYCPDEILVGGGVAIGAGIDWLNSAAAVMKSHLKILPAPTVMLCRNGYDAALAGALELARNGYPTASTNAT